MAPQNITYDKTQKAYLPTRSFRPAIGSPQPAAYLDLLLAPSRPQADFVGWVPPLGLLKYPHRQVKTSVLRQVLLAIREHSMIRVDYQSMNRQRPTEREIGADARVPPRCAYSVNGPSASSVRAATTIRFMRRRKSYSSRTTVVKDCTAMRL